MIPVVTLVGRPNVGKSTLFNRLTRTQDALVADFSGLTRDRQYGQASFNKKNFIVVDTGGLGVEHAPIDALMAKQSELALAEADCIFFLVDGKNGITAGDEEIAQRLRKLGKPLYLIVNKIEGLNPSLASLEFQPLGLKTYGISASHGIGINDLLEEITSGFASPIEEEQALENDAIRVGFIGRPNVGKSTLVNRILGEDRLVVYDAPGTTRDSVYIPFMRNEQKYTLIDTAGIRRRSRVSQAIEKFSIIKTLQSIKIAQICIMVLDAQEGLADQDMQLIRFIVEAGRGLVIAVNKWDGLSQDHKDRVREDLKRRLLFVNFAKIRFISALHGSGVGLLFEDIKQAYDSANQSLSTPKLTRLMQHLVEKHLPPMINGRRIKLRYAHLGGHNPPIIVIHGNQLDLLPNHYKRYLINGFISELNLVGTPIRLEYVTNANPYEGRKNPLNLRQVKKRKRIIKNRKS